MNVRLAAQISRLFVSKVLSTYGTPEATGTAQFCLLMDMFFDIMNVENIDEYWFKRKPALTPFSSPDDPRVLWLTKCFSQYFKDWYNSIQERSNFTPNIRQKCLSHGFNNWSC